MTVAAELYQHKTDSYFQNSRQDLLELIPPPGPYRILELGAGSGATLRTAKARGLASEVVGMDIAKVDDIDTEGPVVDRFIYGNIEELELDFPDNYFDVVLCGDVLEHLVDPWKIVEKIHKHLKPGGLFISSIPNIRNILVLWHVFVKGDFRYSNFGLLDRTHLRYFCRQNIVEMLEQGGFSIEDMKVNMAPWRRRERLINALTFGRIKDLFVMQYRTVARKK